MDRAGADAGGCECAPCQARGALSSAAGREGCDFGGGVGGPAPACPGAAEADGYPGRGNGRPSGDGGRSQSPTGDDGIPCAAADARRMAGGTFGFPFT